MRGDRLQVATEELKLIATLMELREIMKTHNKWKYHQNTFHQHSPWEEGDEMGDCIQTALHLNSLSIILDFSIHSSWALLDCLWEWLACFSLKMQKIGQYDNKISSSAWQSHVDLLMQRMCVTERGGLSRWFTRVYTVLHHNTGHSNLSTTV